MHQINHISVNTSNGRLSLTVYTLLKQARRILSRGSRKMRTGFAVGTLAFAVMIVVNLVVFPFGSQAVLADTTTKLHVQSEPFTGATITGHKLQPVQNCGASCGAGTTNYTIVKSGPIDVVLMAPDRQLVTTLSVKSRPVTGVAMAGTGATGGTTNYVKQKTEMLQFQRWTGCDSVRDLNGDGTARTCIVKVSQGNSKTVVAHYRNLQGIEGEITAPQTVSRGGISYVFQNWTGCDATSGSNGSVCAATVEPGSTQTVTANYESGGEEEGDAPDVTTLSATDINTDDARLRGEVDPNGSSTDVWFEWGTDDDDLDEETSHQSMGSGTSTVGFDRVINDLEPGETYFFRAVGENDFGTDFGSVKSFTTDEEEEEEEGDAPDVTTLSATDIDTDEACLRGEVNPNGDATDAWFEWGTSHSNLDEETDSSSVGSGTSVRRFSFCLDNLREDKTYFFRAVAENDFGDDFGSIRSFTTEEEGAAEEEAGPPEATTLSAIGITSTSATLRGEVDPNNDSTDAWFEWGTRRSLGRKTSDQSVGSGDRDVSVSFVLTGLSSNTTYFFRVAAENSEGDDEGAILSFTTTGPVVVPPPVTTIIERVVSVFREEVRPEEPEIIITLESDKTGLAERDHEIVYTVSYENRTDRTFTDALLEVDLPEDGIDFVDSNPEPDDIEGDTLIFDIGTISPREEDEFEITVEIEDPEVGQDIILSASLSYTNPDGVRNVVTVEDIDEITQGDLTGGLTARILDSLGDFFRNPVFWFLVFLALIFLAYRYLVYMRRRTLPIQPPPGMPQAPTT